MILFILKHNVWWVNSERLTRVWMSFDFFIWTTKFCIRFYAINRVLKYESLTASLNICIVWLFLTDLTTFSIILTWIVTSITSISRNISTIYFLQIIIVFIFTASFLGGARRFFWELNYLAINLWQSIFRCWFLIWNIDALVIVLVR